MTGTAKRHCLALRLLGAACALALFVVVSEAQARCTVSTPCTSGPVDLGDMLNGVAPQHSVTITYAKGISEDGTVVVGYGQAPLAGTPNTTTKGFIWKCGRLTSPSAFDLAYALNVNRAGNVVVGTFANASGETKAFRWTAARGMLELGGTRSAAWAVNDDGSVIVGQTDALTHDPSPHYETHAFRWTKAGGMTDLNTLAGWGSIAYGVNGNGDVVVGLSGTGGVSHAFRWTPNGGMKDLGTLQANGQGESEARAVNRDGKIVVGWSSVVGGDRHPFRWTDATGMKDLGTLGSFNSFSAQASSVSDDGAIVVGWSSVDGPNGPGTGGAHAFRWTAETGIKDLNALLAEAGVNMNGITLTYADAISGNGQFIVAQGGAPASDLRAYLVRYFEGSKSGGRVFAAVTTPQAVEASVDSLQTSRAASLIQHQASADPHVNPLAETVAAQISDEILVVASAKFTPPDLSTQRQATEGNAAIRYVPSPARSVRPFAEAGAWTAQITEMKFERRYSNGSGVSTGAGATRGTLTKVYLAGGVSWRLDRGDDISAATEIGRLWSSIDGYTEPLSALNPMQASVDASTEAVSVTKTKLAWTHGWGPSLQGDVWFAEARAFGASSSLTVSLPAFGEFAADARGALHWSELGGRFDYASGPATVGLAAGAVLSSLGDASFARLSARLEF